MPSTCAGRVSLLIFSSCKSSPISEPGFTDHRSMMGDYVHQFCWNSGLVNNSNGTCIGDQGAVNWPGSVNRVDPRRIIDDFPKWIVLFAVLYTLPHYYWEYFCGGTLAGYMAHLKYLIDAIKKKCETVPVLGIYGSANMPGNGSINF